MDDINILIPTDFSTLSEQALLMADKLSEKLPLKIHLLHVIEGDNHNLSEAVDLAGSHFNSLQKTGKNIEFHIKTGLLTDQIHLAAYEIEADLVIMGTKTSDDFTEFISGWEAQQLSENYKVPVIKLRPGTDNMNLKLTNILLITDFEYFGKGRQINLIKRIVEAFNGTIHLLQILKESDERYIDLIEAQMNFFAKEHHFERFEIHLYRDYQVAGSIQNFNKEAEMDMVCIRTQDSKGIGHLLFGSIAEGLIIHTQKPVLTFRLKRYA